jgi:hypothetical protein
MIMALSLVMAGVLGSVTKVETSIILTNRCVMPNIAEWCWQGDTIRTAPVESDWSAHG